MNPKQGLLWTGLNIHFRLGSLDVPADSSVGLCGALIQRRQNYVASGAWRRFRLSSVWRVLCPPRAGEGNTEEKWGHSSLSQKTKQKQNPSNFRTESVKPNNLSLWRTDTWLETEWELFCMLCYHWYKNRVCSIYILPIFKIKPFYQ